MGISNKLVNATVLGKSQEHKPRISLYFFIRGGLYMKVLSKFIITLSVSVFIIHVLFDLKSHMPTTPANILLAIVTITLLIYLMNRKSPEPKK